jgi:tagatose-6-phosphate ketose/aldose isomerase
MEGFVDLIDRLAAAAEAFIADGADQIDSLVDVDHLRRVVFLGNGDLFGAASESALKVQELTAGAIIAKSEDPLAFRHGPVSAVDANTLVTFFLSADPYTRRYELDVLNQYRSAFHALGARTAVLAADTSEFAVRDGMTALTYDQGGVHRIPRLHQVNLAVLFGQMLGLFASYRMGYDVDEPTSNSGLYARTVQGVQLYDYRAGARVAGRMGS